MRQAVLILAPLLFLNGCGMIRNIIPSKDTTEPPAPLVDFEHRVGVETLWSRDVGASSDDSQLELVPAIDGGQVFASHPKGRVEAYDAMSGAIVWEKNTKARISGGTGIGDGLVLIGTTEGEVIALDQYNGEERWRSRVSSEVLSPPAASGGITVVRTVDGKLSGLNSATGQRIWIYERAVPLLTLRGTATPVIDGDIVLNGFDNGRLVALSLSDGKLLWDTRITLPSGRTEIERMVDIDSEPIIIDDTVYTVTFQGQVAALDLYSGRIIWRRAMSSYAGIGADTNNIYVSDDLSRVWALDRYSNASLWRQNKLRARSVTAPVSYGEYVLVGDYDGYLHLMDREDGQFVGRTQVDKESIRVPPVIQGDTVYVYGGSGRLTALQVR